MKIKMKYFARIAELTGIREEILDVNESILLNDIISSLIEKYGNDLENYLIDKKTNKIKEFFRILINGKISEIENFKIENDSEIVIIPPVSGG